MLALLGASSLEFGAETMPVASPNPLRLSSFEWQPIGSPQYVGEPFRITVLAKDDSGRSYPYNGSALLSTSRGLYALPTVVQFRNGVCDTNAIVTIAESLTLRCYTDSASGVSNVFRVLTGVPRRLVPILPGEQLAPGTRNGRAGRLSPQTAGDSFAFRVYLTDDWFNVIPLRSDSVYFGSDDRFARLPSGGQLSNGIGTFTASLRTAGWQRIIALPALGSSLGPDTSSAVNVASGPFKEMLLVAPGETLLPGDTAWSEWETPGKTGRPDTQFLRRPFDVTVYPCDRCWNVVIGPGDTISLGSTKPYASSPEVGVLREPVAFSLQVNETGDNFVWVRDSLTKAQSYKTSLHVRSRGAMLEIDAPDTVRSGETASVRIRVLDANARPVVAALVLTSVPYGSGRMLVPALLTDTLGFATAHFLCTPSPAAERDSIRVSSGEADTMFGIFVSHLSDQLFAFPNPFGYNLDRALISYHLRRAMPITLSIYDPFGNEVWSRRFRQNDAGAKSGDNVVYWDGRNKGGRRVANGIYVVQVLGTLHTGVEYKSRYRIGVVW